MNLLSLLVSLHLIRSEIRAGNIGVANATGAVSNLQQSDSGGSTSLDDTQRNSTHQASVKNMSWSRIHVTLLSRMTFQMTLFMKCLMLQEIDA